MLERRTSMERHGPMVATEIQSPLEAARKLAPMIRSCADQIEADRELPRPLFEALADAGLFQLALPRALGGAELDLPTYVQVLEEIGKADASTGWIVNQCAIFATYAARMPRHIARSIWIDTPRSIVANTPLPTAQAPGRSTRAALPLRAGSRGGVAGHVACPRHARHGYLSLLRQGCLRARGAHGSPDRRSPARDRTALPNPPDFTVRLGRCRGGPGSGPFLPRRVLRVGWRQDTAGHAGDAPRSANGSSGHRARRSRPPIRTGLPDRGGARNLDRRDIDRRDHAGSARDPAPRRHARDSTG